MSEENPIEQPEAAPAVKMKPKYTLDDAGVLSRVVGDESARYAIYNEKSGIVTILKDREQNEPYIRRVLERMGKKIERVVYDLGPESTPEVTIPETEPKQENHLGERTPLWLAWLKKTDPKRYAAVCERLKISDQP